MEDDAGRQWTVLLKQWTSLAGPIPKPIYVLEKTSEMMKINGAKAGDYMQLFEKDGTLHVLIVDESAYRAARQGSNASVHQLNRSKIPPNSLVDIFSNKIKSKNTSETLSLSHQGKLGFYKETGRFC